VKKAFTLIELLIVVMIMGFVYTLAITKLQKVGDKSTNITLQTLKPFLQSLKYEKKAQILCLDNCSECLIYVDSKELTKYRDNFKNFLDDSVEVYRYDYIDGFVQKEKDIYFNTEDVEESVCFSYSVDNMGIGDQIFVKYKDKVYDFTTYFPPTKVFNSLDDILDKKESLSQQIIR